MKLTAALCVPLFLMASCEVATALLPVAKPVAERTIEVVANPKVADQNADKKTSFSEILAYILGITMPVAGVAGAAYVKASNAQKETDQQWEASAKAGLLTEQPVVLAKKVA